MLPFDEMTRASLSFGLKRFPARPASHVKHQQFKHGDESPGLFDIADDNDNEDDGGDDDDDGSPIMLPAL